LARLRLVGIAGPARYSLRFPGPWASGFYQVKESIMDDIETKVIEIVSEQMGVDKGEITRETHFINDLNADSLDTVELVMEFEDEFELSIPDEEAEKIQTVGQAIDYIKEHGTK
jgi:acyl carrier protein